MTSLLEQVRVALECAKKDLLEWTPQHRFIDKALTEIDSALAAIDAAQEGLETTKEGRADLRKTAEYVLRLHKKGRADPIEASPREVLAILNDFDKLIIKREAVANWIEECGRQSKRADNLIALHRVELADLQAKLATAVAAENEACAQWHDQQASEWRQSEKLAHHPADADRCARAAVEHEVSAINTRARRKAPPSAEWLRIKDPSMPHADPDLDTQPISTSAGESALKDEINRAWMTLGYLISEVPDKEPEIRSMSALIERLWLIVSAGESVGGLAAPSSDLRTSLSQRDGVLDRTTPLSASATAGRLPTAEEIEATAKKLEHANTWSIYELGLPGLQRACGEAAALLRRFLP